MPSSNPSRFALLLLVASAILLLVAAGCMSHGPAPRPVTTAAVPGVPAAPQFVGDAACAKCHPAEFRDQEATRHHFTLRAAARSSLGALAPAPGALPNGAAIEQVGDGYQVVSSPPGRMPQTGPLHFAIGSGKSGVTFVAVMGAHLFEMRETYFPREARWRTTPGQERIPATALGVDHPGSEARRCLLCHVTTLPDNSNVPEQRFFGIGCEACHGAGGAHVAAMQAGRTADLQLERLGALDGGRINALCGECHRTADVAGIPAGRPPDLSVTSRFQSYALSLSRCFRESRGKLSCITCHNPHQDASTDLKAYEAVCLRCHAGPAAPSGAKAIARGKACPVNPRSGCVGCHMTFKRMIPDRPYSILSADHFIRVRRPAQEANWARAWKHDKAG